MNLRSKKTYRPPNTPSARSSRKEEPITSSRSTRAKSRAQLRPRPLEYPELSPPGEPISDSTSNDMARTRQGSRRILRSNPTPTATKGMPRRTGLRRSVKRPVAVRRSGRLSGFSRNGKGKATRRNETPVIPGALNKELKALGVNQEDVQTRQESNDLHDRVMWGEGMGRVTRTSLKMVMDVNDPAGRETDTVAAANPKSTPKKKSGILVKHGLPTPSLSETASINGSSNPPRQTRRRAVSFSDPIELPSTPTPSSITPTSRSTRSKRKFDGVTSDGSTAGPSADFPQPKRRSRAPAHATECAICAETKPTYHNFPTAAHFPQCAHPPTTCIECIAKHTKTILTAKGAWDSVNCPQCSTSLNTDQILTIVKRADAVAFTKLVARKALESDPNFHWCPHPNCSFGQIHTPRATQPLQPWQDTLWYNEQHLVVCKKCKGRGCFRHKVIWHEGYSCERYEDSHPDAEIQRTNEERLKRLGKKCPGKGCDWVAEKDGGCNHMFCYRCNTSWNWSDVKFLGEESSKTASQDGQPGAPAAAATGAGNPLVIVAGPRAQRPAMPQVPQATFMLGNHGKLIHRPADL